MSANKSWSKRAHTKAVHSCIVPYPWSLNVSWCLAEGKGKVKVKVNLYLYSALS